MIDHIYTNNMPHQAASHILLDDISDYMPILMLLNNMKYKSKESNIYIRDTKNLNAENFLIELTKNIIMFHMKLIFQLMIDSTDS